MRIEYILKRNVGTVGRPSLPCAICNFSPSGHVLFASVETQPVPEHNTGLCNVHAQGLKQDAIVTEEHLEQMRQEWVGSQ
jgi:hypothetical protein